MIYFHICIYIYIYIIVYIYIIRVCLYVVYKTCTMRCGAMYCNIGEHRYVNVSKICKSNLNIEEVILEPPPLIANG